MTAKELLKQLHLNIVNLSDQAHDDLCKITLDHEKDFFMLSRSQVGRWLEIAKEIHSDD